MKAVKRQVRRVFCASVVTIFGIGVPFALNGCNTIEGAGEDIEDDGEGISDDE